MKKVLAIVSAVSTAVLAIVVINGEEKEARADKIESYVVKETSKTDSNKLMESKLGFLDDGGVVAYIDSEAKEVLDTMPCVRRPKGLVDCKRTLPDGKIVETGDWSRFLASEAVGTECDPVPCSVWAGDISDPSEE